MTRRQFFIIIFPPVFFSAVIWLRLWLMSPFQIVARYLPRDDLMYVLLGRFLYEGNWLGPYSSLILSKPPGYPLWLAFEREFNLPPLLTEQMLYILAAGLFYRALTKAGLSPVITVLALAVLLMTPEAFSSEQMRLSRVALYDALTMLIIAIAVTTFHISAWWPLCVITFVNSAFLGIYFLIREESIWIVAPYLAFCGCFYWLQRRRKTEQLAAKMLLLLLLPLVMVVASDLFVRAMNHKFYGAAIVYDQRDGNFPRAMGALMRIKTESYRQYVPISREARTIAYRISPAFAELEPLLERGTVKANAIWEGCLAVNVCTDMTTGWIYWAVRSAALRQGYYQNARLSEMYFGRVAWEINQACERKEIECYAPHHSLVPIFRSEMIPAFGLSFIEGVELMFHPEFLTSEDLMKKEWWLSKDKKRAISVFASLMPYAPIYQGTSASQDDKDRISNIYVIRIIWPWLLLLSILAAGHYLFKSARSYLNDRLDSKQAFLISALIVCMVGIGSRLTVLAAVDASSFPGFGHYLMPVYGMAAIFSSIALAAFFEDKPQERFSHYFR